MKKNVRIGRATYGDLFATIEIKDGKLSITGVEGPMANGDCRGGCGQIVMHMTEDGTLERLDFAPGWDADKAARFFAIWQRWHLNDMRAGSRAQESWLRENPVTATYPESHYDKASAALADAGLNPDPNLARNGVPYRYGSAWLAEELPGEIIAELEALPEADKPLPGAWGRD